MRHFTNGVRNIAAWMRPMISEMKSLEEENRRLKRMYADISMQNDVLKEALGKKW